MRRRIMAGGRVEEEEQGNEVGDGDELSQFRFPCHVGRALAAVPPPLSKFGSGAARGGCLAACLKLHPCLSLPDRPANPGPVSQCLGPSETRAGDPFFAFFFSSCSTLSFLSLRLLLHCLRGTGYSAPSLDIQVSLLCPRHIILPMCPSDSHWGPDRILSLSHGNPLPEIPCFILGSGRWTMVPSLTRRFMLHFRVDVSDGTCLARRRTLATRPLAGRHR